MLTFEENYWNFKAIEFFSSLNILPLEIDVESGRIRIQSKKWRLILWKIQYILGFSIWLFAVGRLIQSLYDTQHLKPDHFVMHSIYVLGFGFSFPITFYLFWSKPGELIIIFNDLHQHHAELQDEETTNKDDEQGKSKAQKFGEFFQMD